MSASFTRNSGAARQQVHHGEVLNGGVRAGGGSFVLTGTIGQALVDPTPATAANYRLTGGFHTPAFSS